MNILTHAAMTACISMVISMATVFLMVKPAPIVVTFDVKSTLESYQQTLIENGLSLEEQTAKLTQFADIMHQEVHAFHVEHNAIVMVDAAVVDGVHDVTSQIQQAIVHHYTKE